MSVPAIKLVVWADRDPAWIFVGVPNERGRYLRTDPCVAHVACPYPSRLSIPGEPCKNHTNYVGATHAVRRYAYKRVEHSYQDVTEPPIGVLVPKK